MVAKAKLVSAATLGKKFGLSSRMIQELVASGAIPRSVSTRGYDEDAVTAAYITHLRNHASGRAQAGGVHRETELLRAEQRKNMQLKNAMLEGSLIPVEAIRPAWERIARAVQAALMAAPGAIRFRLPHLTAYDEGVIEEVLRDQMADAGMGLEPPKLDVADPATEVEGAGISDR